MLSVMCCSCRRDPRCCWWLHTHCTFPVWSDETLAQVPADRALLLHLQPRYDSILHPPQPSSYPFLHSYSFIQISEHWALFNCFPVDIWPLTEGQADASRNASCLPNDLLLSLFHGSLQSELSDREIPLTDGNHVAFMHHILERERDGHVAPFSLPVIKGDSAVFCYAKMSITFIQPNKNTHFSQRN